MHFKSLHKMLAGIASLLHLLHPLILRCWPQKRHMNFLVCEKGYFSNAFSKLELTWELTTNDAFIRQISLHTSISVGGLCKSR